MWSTKNRPIAAAYAGLGFRVVTNETEIIELDQWKNLRFEVSETSLTNPHLPHRDDLFRGWKESTLEKLDNDHPFLCGIWAGHNMEKLMKMQDTGESFRLLLEPGSPLYRYERGEEDPRLKLATVRHATVDLPLAAAVSLAGLPVINIDGEPGRRRYLFPDTTHEHLIAADAAALVPVIQFFPRITPGKPSLQLGLTHPQHPIVLGYNGSHAYGVLLGKLKTLKRRLLVKDPYSDRRAIVPENPSHAFEDEMRLHFRIPA